jgi:hypothetical protein
MDFSLSSEQAGLMAQVDRIVDAEGGAERAVSVATALQFDSALDSRLAAEIDLGKLSLLDRVLIADRLAELGTATTFGLRAVVVDDWVETSGPFVVVDRQRKGLARYAAEATTALVLDGDDTRVVHLEAGAVEEVLSGTGYPFGKFDDEVLAGGQRFVAQRVRSRWALALSAEIGGLATAAVYRTGEHLKVRKQFDRPLAQFQALRHRVAEAAVRADATRWMARNAAYAGDERQMHLTASYAAATAAALSPEFVQLWGARGLTHEFGFSTFAMRLQGLRLELGAKDRLALAVVEP